VNCCSSSVVETVSVKFTFLASLIVPFFLGHHSSLIVPASHQASLPIIDVSHPQLVLERSYSWPNPVGLHRAFRLMMTLAGMPFVALVTLMALVMVGMVGVSMMATRLTLLSLLTSLACLLVLSVSAAWT